MRRSLTLTLAALAAIPMQPAPAASPQRLTFEGEDTIFTVEGFYPRFEDDVCELTPPPLKARYRGTIQVELVDGSIRVINELPFGQYLRGIAEVPLSWPTESLRAQVIAARSYALYHYQRGRSLVDERGWHICATDQCQVYRGAAIELGAFGDRWVDAVNDTRGQVLKHSGRVIQAFYHSTTTGRTAPSFPGGTPLPYLQSVPGRDGDAPLARWTAPIRLDQASAVLRALGEWSGPAVTSVRERGSDLVLTGGGRSITMSKSTFRSHMRSLSCMFSSYPNQTGTQTGGRLPEEVPSSTFSVSQRGDTIVLKGRGWGHDVGMSQWGAYGLARRGWNAERILTYYYRDVAIARRSEPRALRVKAAEGLKRLRVFTGSDVDVTTGDGDVLDAGDRFEITIDSGELRIKRYDGDRLDPLLEVTNKTAELTRAPGTRAPVVFRLSRSARVVVRALATDGTEIAASPEASFELGRHTVRLALGDVAPGTYTIVIEGSDGLDRVGSTPSTLTIEGDQVAAPPTTPDEPGNAPAWAVLAAILLLIATGSGVGWRLSRR